MPAEIDQSLLMPISLTIVTLPVLHPI